MVKEEEEVGEVAVDLVQEIDHLLDIGLHTDLLQRGLPQDQHTNHLLSQRQNQRQEQLRGLNHHRRDPQLQPHQNHQHQWSQS